MENTEGNGGPQADGGGEREVPGINRKLKKKNIYPQMTQMEVRKRTMEGNAKLFTHCQLKEVFIKLKQVSEIIRKLKKIILV